MNQEFKIEVIMPFGPSIAKVKIPENILNELNTYVDNVVKDTEKSKKLDHGKKLVGQVKQEFYIEPDFAKKCGWLDFLAQSAAKWIQVSTNREIKEFNLLKSWVVRQFENEYNPIHYHSGHISGAGFLKLPSSFGETSQDDKKLNENGNLKLVHGNKQFLSKCMYRIKPKVGEFYFFPHYLMHVVYPFNSSDEERRSISFNAQVDDSVFNVFSS